MGVLTALGTALEAVNRLMQRVWGDQTAAQSSLEKRAIEAARKKNEALLAFNAAQKRGDHEAEIRYLSAFNGWATELRRVSDAADAVRKS
jgi:hypothetical protein